MELKVNSLDKQEDEEEASLLSGSVTRQSAQALVDTIEEFSRSGVSLLHFGALSFKQKDVIAQGKNHKIFRGYLRDQPVAIKVLSCQELSPIHIRKFFDEVQVLSSLKHPNIVGFEGVCIAPPSLSVVVELCKGNLYDFLRQERGGRPVYTSLSWQQKAEMMLQMAQSLDYLHSLNPPLIHSNLHSRSFLVAQDNRIKVISLTFSKNYLKEETQL